MSLRMWIYSISEEDLGSIYGSNDQELLETLQAEVEDQDDPTNMREWPPGTILLSQAAEELITGKYTTQQTTRYLEVLEMAVQLRGEVIVEESGLIGSKALDVELEKRGVHSWINRKILYGETGDFPIPLPTSQEPGDFPAVGYVSAKAVRASFDALTPLDLMGLDTKLAKEMIGIYSLLKKVPQGCALMVFCS